MLSVRSLRCSYGSTPVLHGVSLAVPAGEVCGLFGPNGSGKTTLFRCCLGLLPSQAEELSVDGHDVRHLRPNERARLIAYVPQEHHPAFPMRVEEMVMLGRTPHLGLLGRPSAHDRRIVAEAIERLGLGAVARCRCDRLSGGQRQLVLVARAIVQETPAILLDEPASGLDLQNQALIWGVLRRLAAEGKAIVCCTHDPNHVAWFCGRAVVLMGGMVVSDGHPADALDARTLERLYPASCTVHRHEGLRVVLPRLAGGTAPVEGRP